MDSMLRFDFAPVAVSHGGDTQSAVTEVSGLVVPYGVPVPREWGTATFTQEGTALPLALDTVKLLVQHDDERPVGYATAYSNDADGLRMTFAVPNGHDRSGGYLDDLGANLRDGFSIGFEMDADTRAAVWDAFLGDGPADVPMSGMVREVSAVSVPAFNDARADRAAAASQLVHFAPARKAPAVTAVIDPDPPATPAPAFALEDLAARVAPLIPHLGARPHALAAYATLAEYADAAWKGAAPRVALALVDQVTPDNPGVVPPAFLSDIVGIIDRGRPAITALGGPRALPPNGMELDWPVFAGNLSALVGVQAAEKTDIVSVKVSLTKGTAALKTFAGGSDISYQLVRRSSPAYLDAYLRIMGAAYAATTENDFEDTLLAQATPHVAGALGTADQVRAALFAASSLVANATGAPANVVLVSPDVYAAWGGMPGLVPAAYGTQNVPGTAQASTLDISVSGLSVTEGPYLTAGSVIVTNDIAAQWYEDGPFTVQADDVNKLGLNVAVWGMGATRVAVPAGLLKLTSVIE